MLTADNWCIKVHEKVYGPYSSEQLRKFAHEGRLAGWSLIAPAGSREWREARRETSFASFFGATAEAPAAAPAFGRRLDETARPAERRVARPTGTAKRARAIGQPAPDDRPREAVGPANFVIIFDVVSGAAGRIETAITTLGSAFRIADNVWTVQCSMTAIGVRNALAPYLRGSESIFVVDATHGRTSWQNYAPEAHAKLTVAFMTKKQ